MILKWERSRNDLHAKFECVCPSKSFIGTQIEHLMKTKIHLRGYYDANYFYNVNKEARVFACNCGKKYTVQWFDNGNVEVMEV